MSPPDLRAWWLEYFIPFMAKFSNGIIGEGYAKDAWHLHLFAIHPEYQGKGYGKLLYKFAEAEAKKTNSDILLETSTDLDVIIYSKLGFKVRGETAIVNEKIGTNKMVLMTKDAAGIV